MDKRVPPLEQLRRRIAGEVVSLFNDRSRGEAPVIRRPAESWFGPDSVTWGVHGDVTAMMVGGVASLLLQMLHPKVLAGVWDHSNFRADMHGRLRRTARFIATTTYAAESDAQAAIARVRAIHAKVSGTLPDGTPYVADDPRLLAWVHVTETWSFLAASLRYGRKRLSAAEQDRYFAEMARVGHALGADPVPTDRRGAEALIATMRPELRVDERTREVSRLVLEQRPKNPLAQPAQALVMQAGVDLLPGWARSMQGLGGGTTLGAPLVRAGTLGVARTLRWAFG
ncbi:oxygenase MpaB family protein [Sphingomonas jatrophae]